MKNPTYDEFIREAAGWILDCGWNDDPKATVDTILKILNERQIIRRIERNYEGGIRGFINSM